MGLNEQYFISRKQLDENELIDFSILISIHVGIAVIVQPIRAMATVMAVTVVVVVAAVEAFALEAIAVDQCQEAVIDSATTRTSQESVFVACDGMSSN